MGRKSRHLNQRIEREVEDRLGKAGVKSILVAISGGADSVALLSLCCLMANKLGLKVEAVNCNFHLRGEESDRDSRFTADLCLRLEVKLHSLEYDVEAYLQSHPGVSAEMACRELRYADFFRIMEERGLNRVAVAHNADDDIETMMLNMLRGSGSRGLRGMDFDNGRIIRPLLSISRKEIEEYLAGQGIGFITDSSNLTSEYRRNFIRREVLPLLEQRWAGARKSLSKTIAIMKEESEIIERHYLSELSRLNLGSGELDVYAEGVTAGVIHRFLEPFGGNPEIADEILNAIGKDFSERTWKLSDKYQAQLERDRLKVVECGRQDAQPVLTWEELEMSAEVMKEVKGNRSHDVIYLPSDASAYELRRPEPGDRMAPLGMKGSRLVSDIISDARLDREKKDAVRLLVRKSDGKIIWATGLKRSRHDLIPNDCGKRTIYKATCSSYSNPKPINQNPINQ